MVKLSDLSDSEYAPYYIPYLELLPQDCESMEQLESNLSDSISVFSSIQKPMSHTYANGKWTIGQLIQHCLDTERIFSYRALSFMRGDTTALAGFDQDIYSDNLRNYAFAKADLLQSIPIVRASTIDLFKNTTPESLNLSGVASGYPMTARAIPFVICGHWQHHLKILKERY